MLTTVFTLDYEIHGNGDGDPYQLMVEPTNRMLDSFDAYGAKLTILADVAEILKFKEYYEATGVDTFYYNAIVKQLCDAVKRGHDVQLHLHSSYFKARYEAGKWQQCWEEYDFASLPLERMDEMVKRGKAFLENLLKPINQEYQCIAFRAANWSTNPSQNLIRVLKKNDITIETSVFKYGVRNSIVNFDYSGAWHEMYPWPVSESNVCVRDVNSSVVEFPIYCVQKNLFSFLTLERIKRVIVTRMHSVKKSKDFEVHLNVSGLKTNNNKLKTKLLAKYPWKADFNQCTGRQLVKEIKIACNKYNKSEMAKTPFVLIGHSKSYSKANQKTLIPFLMYIKSNSDKYGFALFKDFNLNEYK